MAVVDGMVAFISFLSRTRSRTDLFEPVDSAAHPRHEVEGGDSQTNVMRTLNRIVIR